MSTSILYFLTSPFQVRSAQNHRKSNNQDKNATFLVVMGMRSRKKNYSQMKSAVNELRLSGDKVVALTYTNKYLYEFQLNLATKKLAKNYDSLCVGDIRDMFTFVLYKRFECKRLFLVDDGAVSIVARSQIIKNGIAYPSIMSRYDKLRKKIYGMLGYNFKRGIPVELNSIFDGQQVKNKNISRSSLIGKSVFFLGSKYSEANIITLNDELCAIKQVLDLYIGTEIIYIPHRDDSAVKISAIKELNIKVLSIDEPIEQHFKGLCLLPSAIVGFWTTALYTLSIEYEFQRVDSFDILSLVNDKKTLKNAESIYNYYKNVGIHVATIDGASKKS